MKIRIYRKYSYVLDAPRPVDGIVFGARYPHKLVSRDVLQYLDESNDTWYDVPIVEGEKPPYPS